MPLYSRVVVSRSGRLLRRALLLEQIDSVLWRIAGIEGAHNLGWHRLSHWSLLTLEMGRVPVEWRQTSAPLTTTRAL